MVPFCSSGASDFDVNLAFLAACSHFLQILTSIIVVPGSPA